jgi:hypothetical protein
MLLPTAFTPAQTADFKATGANIMAAAALLSDKDLAAAIPKIQDILTAAQTPA